MMRSSRTSSARLDSSGALGSQDLTAMHIAGMRERNTAGGGALDAIAAFRWSSRWDFRGRVELDIPGPVRLKM